MLCVYVVYGLESRAWRFGVGPVLAIVLLVVVPDDGGVCRDHMYVIHQADDE